MRAAATAVNVEQLARYDARNPQALKRLVANGVQLRPFSQPIMEACLKASNEVNAETSATNADFKKVLASQNAFRGDAYLWWQVAEYGYDTFIDLATARSCKRADGIQTVGAVAGATIRLKYKGPSNGWGLCFRCGRSSIELELRHALELFLAGAAQASRGRDTIYDRWRCWPLIDVVVGCAGRPYVAVFAVVEDVRTGSSTNFSLLISTLMSCWPMPRKPPTPMTMPSTLPDLSSEDFADVAKFFVLFIVNIEALQLRGTAQVSLGFRRCGGRSGSGGWRLAARCLSEHPSSRPPTFHIFFVCSGMTRWAAWLLTLAGGTGVCLALYALVGQEIVGSIAETLASHLG